MENVRIAIVGMGFGKWVVDLIASSPDRGLELAAVCDLDRQKVQPVAEKYGVKAYTDLEALLAEPSIPAIGLITGPAGRASLIRQIIRAGKHVLTTKPFERDPVAALDVLREAQRLGRVVHINSPGPLPSAGDILVQKWRAQHDLGRPIAARLDTWVNYAERADGNWYDDPQLCPVPPIFRLGIYSINELVALFGEARKVVVLESRLITGRPTSDNAQLGILFKNGAIANVFSSFCVTDGDRYRDSMTLNFERGTIYRNCGPNRLAGAAELSLIVRVDNERRLVERVELSVGGSGYQLEHFCRAVRGEKLEGEISPEQIVMGRNIIDAMARAAQCGGVADVAGCAAAS